MKNGLNVKAFCEFGQHIADLEKAVMTDDVQKQLIALTQAIDALQDAKRAMVVSRGGILN
jgi:hypothetical protein